MRNAIKAGDEIVTIGGICGKIVKTKDESLVIQVGADKVKFEIMRWAVSKVVSESSAPAPAPAAEEEAEPKKPSRPKRMKAAAAPAEEKHRKQQRKHLWLKKKNSLEINISGLSFVYGSVFFIGDYIKLYTKT